MHTMYKMFTSTDVKKVFFLSFQIKMNVSLSNLADEGKVFRALGIERL